LRTSSPSRGGKRAPRIGALMLLAVTTAKTLASLEKLYRTISFIVLE
jgi:hypothetical protein